jgi:Protein of unknown function (DUF4231)
MISAAPIELRPPPLLAIGIAGHRRVGIDGENARAVAAALDALLRQLDAAFRTIVAAERAFFSGAQPTLRLVGMAAEGSSLLGARAARARGAEIACVLPFAPSEYENDFSSPAALALARTIIASASSLFVLPGERSEGARAYERANNVILANVDVLIAVWNGARADGRAGTGDVVQSAVAWGIPVVAIDPACPACPTLLLGPGEDELEHPVATDLRRKPLDGDLTPLLQQIIAPPSGSDKRQGLGDLNGEQPGKWAARFEYPLLLKIFAVGAGRTGMAEAPADGLPGPSDGATSEVAAAGGGPGARLRALRQCAQLIDGFAGYYGRLFRSSNASAFLLIIFAALLSATLTVLFPAVFGVWVVGQMIVNGLVVIDATIASRRRWHERWLDYRLAAERLRCVGFLHPLGLGLDRVTGFDRRSGQSWVEWYVRRMERSLGTPARQLQPADVGRAARRLADVEIQEQIDYHRRTFRQLRILERRLAAVARVTLRATLAVAAALGVFAYFGPALSGVAWRPLALVLLFALPAATSAFQGLRAEADLARLAERSATAAIALARLRRLIGAASPTYDHVAVAAMRAASIMGAELSDWRFVLERRRARARRPPVLGRSRLRRR